MDNIMIIGFTCGAFDLFHPGHIFFLEEAKANCDRLIVGLHTDPSIDRPNKNKPVQTTFERYSQLEGCRSVDRIVPYDTEQDLLNILGTYAINKRFVGEDYKDSTFTGIDICNKRNIEICFLSRRHNYSSTELRKRVYNAEKIKR
jgi:glycerol-3-phosphate cytidylyltransferase